ncbi:Ig-like domain-containing protein, partial [Endobacterium cereale]
TVPTPASGLTLSVTAAITDIAGNTATPTTVTAVVDTIVPMVPVVAFENDTGTIGDGISTDGTILVSGIEPGATWQYSTNGGLSWTNGSGAGFELGVGTFNVQVRQTDAAGNTATRNLGPVRIFNLDAINDAATLNLTVTPVTAAQPQQTGQATSVLSLGVLAGAVDVSLLAGQTALQFNVAQNTTQQVSLSGGGNALLSLSLIGDNDYDLYVYRADTGSTQAQLVYQLPNWLDYSPGLLGLLSSWSGPSVALPQFQGGGTYYVVLGNSGAVLNLSALANITVQTTSNTITDYRDVSGSLTGNVLTGDITVAGTVVASVDQTPILATSTVIDGDYGTLTINRNGSYTYVPDRVFTGSNGAQDVFTYTIASPDGSTDTATLTVTLGYPGGPQATFALAEDQGFAGDDLIALSLLADPTADHGDPAHTGVDLDLGLGLNLGEDQQILSADINTGDDLTVHDGDPSNIDLNVELNVDLGTGGDQQIASADINADDLTIDDGGQEIDLAALTQQGGEPVDGPLDTDPAQSTGAEPAPVTFAETSETPPPLDPFEPIHNHDELNQLPVV